MTTTPKRKRLTQHERIIAAYNKGLRERREKLVAEILAIRPNWNPEKLHAAGKEQGLVKLQELLQTLKTADAAAATFA